MSILRYFLAIVVAFAAAIAVERARWSHVPDACGLTGVSADSSFRAYLVDFEAGANLFINGDASLLLAKMSHRDDVTLLNPFGYNARGWPDVEALYSANAKRFIPSGARASLDYLAVGVEGNFAYTVTLQRVVVRRVGDPAPYQAFTRATNVFRREQCQWKLVHRQMDHTRPPEEAAPPAP